MPDDCLKDRAIREAVQGIEDVAKIALRTHSSITDFKRRLKLIGREVFPLVVLIRVDDSRCEEFNIPQTIDTMDALETYLNCCVPPIRIEYLRKRGYRVKIMTVSKFKTVHNRLRLSSSNPK